MQSQRLELMMDIAEKELSGLTSIHNELSRTLGEKLMDTIDLIEKIDGNVVLSGIGKSGMIANKIAATLTSTGTSSFFLHGTEASHGDLGLLKENDILLFFDEVQCGVGRTGKFLATEWVKELNLNFPT